MEILRSVKAPCKTNQRHDKPQPVLLLNLRLSDAVMPIVDWMEDLRNTEWLVAMLGSEDGDVDVWKRKRVGTSEDRQQD